MSYSKKMSVSEVKINDGFWTPYIKNVREITLPYVFKKFEETGYMKNYKSVAENDGKQHEGPQFTDGLLLETVRAASDFLATEYDEKLDKYLDGLIDLFSGAMAEDGYLSTVVMQDYPEKRWGENGGSIIRQHDLYNHGALVEAAVSHYLATGKTTLLLLAVRAANLICKTIGKAPKLNIVPGHSMPEEAFVKLYTLFRDDRTLDGFASKNGVDFNNYIEIVRFWYDARGDRENRTVDSYFAPEYNQDHMPFSKQTEAVGHSVRAMLCYIGAAAYTLATGNEDYKETLNLLWENVANKRIHISGGIGTDHKFEGFTADYDLPNDAYLETCAGIALAFFCGEMNLIKQDSRYFDCFELALYNNILAAIGDSFTQYYYQNPLQCKDFFPRWEWHWCPCCPPMLVKIYSSLGSYIYSYDENSISVNMYIGSTAKNEKFEIEQNEKKFKIDSFGKNVSVKFRIPAYGDDFELYVNGKKCDFETESGYAVIRGIFDKNTAIEVKFDETVKRIFANPKVEYDKGLVAFMKGKFLLCAEGIDNGGDVEFTVAENPELKVCGETVTGKDADGKEFTLVPYHKWCNRIDESKQSKMTVWIPQENMADDEILKNELNGKLYGNYEKL